MRLVLTNETHWRSDDLRRIIRATIEHEGMADEGRTFYVEIYYGRRPNDVMGWAYLNSSRFRLGLPKTLAGEGRWSYEARRGDVYRRKRIDVDELPERIVRRVAAVTVHELCHCRGLEHGEMTNDNDTSWLDPAEFPIRKKAAAKPKPKEVAAPLQKATNEVERVDELIAKEEKRHAAHMKRLCTRRRKALASKRYYERKDAL